MTPPVYGRIYLVTNKINGKKYVGQTVASIQRRWRAHCWDSLTGRKTGALNRAIRKYGPEKFTVEEIDTAFSKEDLDARELAWVSKLNSISPNGYNLTEGGGSAGRPSRDTVERRRLALLGHPTSQATKDKIRNSQIGRVLTPEHREKLRQAKLGRKQDPEMVERRNAAIRAAYLERHNEIVPKIVRAHLGSCHSEETKEKMRVAARNRKGASSEQL